MYSAIQVFHTYLAQAERCGSKYVALKTQKISRVIQEYSTQRDGHIKHC
jgi:hypothetical protein